MVTSVTKEQSARDRMHHIIDIVEEDKVKAMLILFQDLEEEYELFEYPVRHYALYH